MAIQVIELGNEVVTADWERIEFSVDLPDMKQIVISAIQGIYVWDSVTNKWVMSNNKKKFRVTGFEYKLDEGSIVLYTIKGNFFTKANRLGARESLVHVFDQETLDQIPDELHDKAREHFSKEVTPMLEKIIEKGLVIQTNA
jgi:hypothetical protein